MKAWNNKIWDFPRRRHGLILRELLDGEITGITASMFGHIWSDIKDEYSMNPPTRSGSRGALGLVVLFSLETGVGVWTSSLPTTI